MSTHTPGKRIRITPKEAALLWNTAGNMADDFLDYYGSMYGDKEAKRLEKIYKKGMEKLRAIMKRDE